MPRPFRKTLAGVLAVPLALLVFLGVPALASAAVALGVNTADAPGRNGAALDAFTAKTGRAPALVMWYQSFSEPLFYSSQMPAVYNRGAVPLITWEPVDANGGVSLRDIANGSRDAYLQQAAADARQWGHPFYVRFAHEMNGSWYSWGKGVEGNTAADYVSAWRHVVQTFRDEGATNVKWVWSPNTSGFGTAAFDEFYPGDAWTDWVGLDGYNWGSNRGSGWRSFREVFGASYAALTALTNKPVMIAETGAPEDGGNKAAWITAALLEDLPRTMPAVRAVVWFDRDKEADWRVDSSPGALTAFRAAVTSPLFALDRSELLAIGPRTETDQGPTPVAEVPPVRPSAPAAAPLISVAAPVVARPPQALDRVVSPARPPAPPNKSHTSRPRLSSFTVRIIRKTLKVSVRLEGGSCPRCSATLISKRDRKATGKRLARAGTGFLGSVRRARSDRTRYYVVLRDRSGRHLMSTPPRRVAARPR